MSNHTLSEQEVVSSKAETSLAISLSSVTKRYGGLDNGETALQEIDLEIRRGEFVIIVGPSGSGKSTLLNLIGLIDQPTKGSVSIFGEDAGSVSESVRASKRASSIGLIFQSFNLIPVLSAIENVMLAGQIGGLKAVEARTRASNLMKEFGLETKLDSRPDLLSGGQRQRVAICRALINKPLLLIADEPTANLDTVNAMQLMKLLKTAQIEQNVTVVLATHDHRVLEFATRVLYIEDGRFLKEA